MNWISPLHRVLAQPHDMPGLSEADWDEVIRLARVAEVMARLAGLARSQGVWAQLPPAVCRHLRSAELLCQRQHTEVAYELQEIDLALRELGVPVLVLKGAAYVRAGLAAGVGRMVGDIDILVPKIAMPDVESQLLLKGWMSSSRSAYDQRYYREWMHELPPMTHMKRGTVLDVHHAILPVTARLHPSTDALLAHAQPLIDGTCLRRPDEVDLLLHSATHLTHEGEFDHGLRGLVDIDALVREGAGHADFWPRVVSRSQAMTLARPVFYGLRYARLHLHTPVPDAVMHQLAAVPGAHPGRWALRYMDAMFDQVLRVPHPVQDSAYTPLARQFMYLRGHWLRMPPHLLALHLARKAWMGLWPAKQTDVPDGDTEPG